MENTCYVPPYFKPLERFESVEKQVHIERNRKPWYYISLRLKAPKDVFRYFKAQGQYLNVTFAIMLATCYNLRDKKIGYIQTMCKKNIADYNKRHPTFSYRGVTIKTDDVPAQFIYPLIWRATTHFWTIKHGLEEYFMRKKTITMKDILEYLKTHDVYKFIHYDPNVPRFTFQNHEDTGARLRKLLGINCRSVYKRRFRLSYDFAPAVVIPEDYFILNEMEKLNWSQYKVHRFDVIIPYNEKVQRSSKKPLSYNMRLFIYVSPKEMLKEPERTFPFTPKKKEVKPTMLFFDDMPEVRVEIPIKPKVKIPKSAKRDWDGFYHLHYKNPFIIQRFDVKEPLNISDVFPLCKLENRRYVHNPGDILGQYDDDFYQIRMLYWFWRERYDRVIEVMRDIVKDYKTMDFFIEQFKQAMHNMYDFWIKIEDNLPEEIREERVRGLQEQQRRRYEMAELNLDRDRMRDEEDYSLAAR